MTLLSLETMHPLMLAPPNLLIYLRKGQITRKLPCSVTIVKDQVIPWINATGYMVSQVSHKIGDEEAINMHQIGRHRTHGLSKTHKLPRQSCRLPICQA